METTNKNQQKETIIQWKDICFAYEGQVALRHVNLDIHKGETIIFQGANGSGKSTALRLMNGLVFPEQGTYTYEGKEISKETMKDNKFSRWFHQRMGYVFQNSDVQLFCSNVEEEIAFGPSQMGLSEEEVERRTNDVIALLNIEHLRSRAPYHLSGGEKKRVAIACILSMNPEVLVLDEPLAGLDHTSQEWLEKFLVDLKKAGKTMIIATHNTHLGELLGDRHILFEDNHEVKELKAYYHTHTHVHYVEMD